MKTIGQPILTGLSDVCVDILSFAIGLRSAKDLGSFDSFRTRVDELFKIFDARASQANVLPANAAIAKYALVAFVDEIILNSNTPLKEIWSGRPLQLEYFNDFAAGEEFFNKLETVRHTDDPKKVDVLEVYYLCLVLGFKGKFGGFEGLEKLRVLIEEISREIRTARSKDAPSLFHGAKGSAEVPTLVKTIPVWILLVGLAGILLLLFGLLSWQLGSSTQDSIGRLGLSQ